MRDRSGNVKLGARVAMIGAGPLARMTHQAAIDYGIVFHVLATSPHDPAVTAGAAFTIGHYNSYSDLLVAATQGDVVTFEHNFVPIALLQALARSGHRLRPAAQALAISHDNLTTRRLFSNLGHLSIPMANFAPACIEADAAVFGANNGWPVVLKAMNPTGSDHGAQILDTPDDARRLLPKTCNNAEPAWVLEEYLDLAVEFTVLVARRPSGEITCYPPIGKNRSASGRSEVIIPAPLPAVTAATASRLAESIISGINGTGICAVEFFWTADNRLILNKLSLRPHNSGYITMEACATSQFHQHLRAALDWPLGSTELRSAAATVSIIGGSAALDSHARLIAAMAIPGTTIHLYGNDPRPGEQLGHVTALASTTDDALELARSASELLTQP